MKYIIQKKEDRVLSFLLDEAGHAVEIHADRPADGPKLGDIYIGLVQKVAKHIDAAFVELVPGVNGYLPLEELVEPIFTRKGPSPDLQAGDQLVVQITRDAFGKKDMSLTTRLSLKGTYTVLTLGSQGVGVSKKLPDAVRAQLREQVVSAEAFGQLQERIGPCGIVFRTAAGALCGEEDGVLSCSEKTLKLLRRELSGLEAELTDLRLKAPYRTVYTALKKQPPRWLSRLERLRSGEAEAVVTDDLSLYRQMVDYLGQEMNRNRLEEQRLAADPGTDQTKNVERKRGLLRYYQDAQVSMEKLFSLERELERALKKRVDLKSGGDLVVESTEALHVIDVNSGRFQSGKDKEEAVLRVNLEAAREAARQIRLRNLSGIILIDFINLLQAKNSLRVLEELRQSTARDPIRTQVVDMTRLGLVEITRQKIEVPLAQAMAERN